MDASFVKSMGRELRHFVAEFDDCFGRREPREHLRAYIRGQLSDLPRKSVEPIALAAKIPPRTLQWFLNEAAADDERMRDHTQQIVARDHAHPQAIGIVDESGNPKKGRHTAGVGHQWCGRSGKIDNCVMAVHLGYVADDFECLLDSDLFLPEDWANDQQRRAEVGVPADVVFRTKPQIAMAQVRRALRNGIRVAAWTFDEGYGRGAEFLDGLDALGQNYVGEIPSDFYGWTLQPRVLLAPRPQELHRTGRKWRYPRVARKSSHACAVNHLAAFSPAFTKQKWQRFRIKDTEKGPMVWEVKCCPFWRKHGERGLPGPMHTLMVARNVLNPEEVKYFLSNLVAGSAGASLERLLWIAFSRWPIERCFQVAKTELGMDHFEVRSWRGIHRHLYISQLSQLFCARVHHRHREKNDRESVLDRGTGADGGMRLGGSSVQALRRPARHLPGRGGKDRLLPGAQPAGPGIPYTRDCRPAAGDGHRRRSTTVMCSIGSMN
jgi:SRSO17 transposase